MDDNRKMEEAETETAELDEATLDEAAGGKYERPVKLGPYDEDQVKKS